MPELIREAVRRLEDPDLVCYALGDLDRVLVAGRVVRPQTASAATDELVLSRVDGTRTLRELVQLVPRPSDETQRALLGLLYTGLLESRPAAEASEASPHPGSAESRQEPEPATATTDPQPAAADRGEAREGRVRFRALDHLEDLGLPRCVLPQDPVENALLADDVIRKAKHLMAESDNWSAIQLLEAVIPRIRATEMRHKAQVALARACSRNPKWVKRGEEMLQAVVREDPGCADAYFMLGVIYKQNGFRARALAMFRKVGELKPGHAPAAEEIRSLDVPSSQKKPFRTA